MNFRRLIVAACLIFTACENAFYTEPASAPTTMAIQYSLASSPGAAFDKADRIAVTVTRAVDNAVVLDTVFAFSPAAETRVRIPLVLEQDSAVYRIRFTLRQGTAALFTGETTAILEEGETNSVDVPQMVAQVAGVTMPTSVPAITALGDTVTIIASAAFATGDPLAGSTLTWTSSNPSVATVNANGRVHALSEGTTIIKAEVQGTGTAQGTVSAQVQVTVAATVQSVTVTPANDSISVGATRQFTAVARDRNNNTLTRTFAWSSSTPSVATIGATTGLATAVATGQTTITASAGTAQGTATLTVASVSLLGFWPMTHFNGNPVPFTQSGDCQNGPIFSISSTIQSGSLHFSSASDAALTISESGTDCNGNPYSESFTIPGTYTRNGNSFTMIVDPQEPAWTGTINGSQIELNDNQGTVMRFTKSSTTSSSSLQGTWGGIHTWNCSTTNAGSVPITFNVTSASPTSAQFSGTATYHGGSGAFTGTRYSSATFTSLGSVASGVESPTGTIINIEVPATAAFGFNEFTGNLDSNGVRIVGTTINGNRCSANTGPGGTFDVSRQ